MKGGTKGTAVDLDKGAVLVLARIVDGPGNHSFAGARFTKEEHGSLRGGHLFHLTKDYFEEVLVPIISPKS